MLTNESSLVLLYVREERSLEWLWVISWNQSRPRMSALYLDRQGDALCGWFIFLVDVYPDVAVKKQTR